LGGVYCVAVAQDDVPKLADWLAEYRSRPEPVEVVVAAYDSVEPTPDTPANMLDAGRVGLVIVCSDSPGSGPQDDSRFVFAVDARGKVLWDHWYETEQAAREAFALGWYGEVVERGADG
jgi:hypothetical protein